MRTRLLIAFILWWFATLPAYAQVWDQVNGSMQVKSGPSTPLVIIDQTNATASSKALSIRANGTEKCSVDIDGDLVCVGTFTLTGQAIGSLDTDCSAPAYSGLGKLTTGFAVRTAPTGVVCVGGTLTTTFSATQLLLADAIALAWSDVTLSRLAANVVAVGAGDAYGLAAAFAIRTAPTTPVACTTPTVVNSNGTASFEIDVGSTCAGVTTLVVTMPAATNAWQCVATNLTTSATAAPEMTASTTTSITITNYTRTTGLALDWADGANVGIGCWGR